MLSRHYNWKFMSIQCTTGAHVVNSLQHEISCCQYITTWEFMLSLDCNLTFKTDSYKCFLKKDNTAVSNTASQYLCKKKKYKEKFNSWH